MRSLIVYDSNFGNTKEIADAIAAGIGDDATVVKVRDVGESDMAGMGLIVVGSPILGWRPSEKISKFLNNFRGERLRGVKAAAFDTRMKLFFHGDAAHKISKALEEAGATIITDPTPFFVKGKEGPLFKGEVERATEWGRKMGERM